MDPTSPALRLALAIGSGLVLVGGVAGVAVHDGGKAKPAGTLSAGGGATTTSLLGEGPGTLPAGSLGTLPSAGSGTPGATTATTRTSPTTSGASATTAAPTTTAAGTPTTKKGAAPASSATPPKLGKYVYHVTEQNPPQGQAADSDQTTTVEAGAAASGGTTNLVITIPSEVGTLKNDTGWSSTGVLVRSSVITAQGATVSCDWNPDFLQYQEPLKAGASWNVSSTCKTKVSGIDITITLTETNTVVQASSAVVEGVAYPTWQIKRHTETKVDSVPLKQSVVADSVEQFAPASGLPLATHTTSTSTVNGQSQPTVTSDSVLKSLTPTA